MPGTQRGFGGSVSAGRGSAQTLTNDDVAAIRKEVTNVTAVAQSYRDDSNYQDMEKYEYAGCRHQLCLYGESATFR